MIFSVFFFHHFFPAWRCRDWGVWIQGPPPQGPGRSLPSASPAPYPALPAVQEAEDPQGVRLLPPLHLLRAAPDPAGFEPASAVCAPRLHPVLLLPDPEVVGGLRFLGRLRQEEEEDPAANQEEGVRSIPAEVRKLVPLPKNLKPGVYFVGIRYRNLSSIKWNSRDS